MTDLTDIARKLDELTLEEMLAEAENHAANADLPEAGGEYDTLGGWKKRLGVTEIQMDKLLAWAVEHGFAEKGVRGRVRRGSHWYSVNLIHSPMLGERAG